MSGKRSAQPGADAVSVETIRRGLQVISSTNAPMPSGVNGAMARAFRPGEEGSRTAWAGSTGLTQQKESDPGLRSRSLSQLTLGVVVVGAGLQE